MHDGTLDFLGVRTCILSLHYCLLRWKFILFGHICLLVCKRDNCWATGIICVQMHPDLFCVSSVNQGQGDTDTSQKVGFFALVILVQCMYTSYLPVFTSILRSILTLILKHLGFPI